MLFDLRSRGRRRTVQVIYLGLAILIGGGLILFGVGTGTGGGGLLNGLGGNGSNSGQSQAATQATNAALKQVKLNPNSSAAWFQLEQAYWAAAGNDSTTDSTTGVTIYSANGKKLLAKASDAWQHYLTLTKNPSADAAILAARAYAQQGQYKAEAAAWQYVIQSNPGSAKGYECLAFSAYAAKDPTLGDLAAAKTLKLAPKLQQLQLKSALTASKTQPLYAREC
jgi:tetratricopeptide (TPR) repeat protein